MVSISAMFELGIDPTFWAGNAVVQKVTFVTLEDETGVANLIIRMDVWERFYKLAHTAPAYSASGRLQNQQGVIHVLVSR